MDLLLNRNEELWHHSHVTVMAPPLSVMTSLPEEGPRKFVIPSFLMKCSRTTD